MRTKEKFELINLGYDIAQNSEKIMLREKIKLLLEEIERRIERKKEKRREYVVDNRKCELFYQNEGYIDALNDIKGLIKKAFEDVMEDEE
ncbi:hypothetical protein DRH14_04105 [Candidatus Shapirobacteria bacterium]|nr:MAG: hypothetical protein DRH14_04105 [Candidatus Shapirobacteria bacterium]